MIDGYLVERSRQNIVLPRVKRTETLLERTRGLLGSTGLAEGEGLLIAPCNSVHTCFMTYPIDIIFLERSGRIVKIVNALKPYRFTISLAAAFVLETAAGQAARNKFGVGDHLDWVKST